MNIQIISLKKKSEDTNRHSKFITQEILTTLVEKSPPLPKKNNNKTSTNNYIENIRLRTAKPTKKGIK